PLANLLWARQSDPHRGERQWILGHFEEGKYITHGSFLRCRGIHRLHQLDVETQRLQFLDHNVEALVETRLERIVALDDGLVHSGSSLHVVALDGEELL